MLSRLLTRRLRRMWSELRAAHPQMFDSAHALASINEAASEYAALYERLPRS